MKREHCVDITKRMLKAACTRTNLSERSDCLCACCHCDQSEASRESRETLDRSLDWLQVLCEVLRGKEGVHLFGEDSNVNV